MVDETAKTLFEHVLRDPFGLESRDHVDQWHHHLMQKFPLWSFQAWAYKALLRRKIPSNYPLQVMINSIVRDEGMTPRHLDRTRSLEPATYNEGWWFYSESKKLGPLECAVDVRRYNLANEGRYGPPAPPRSTTDPYDSLPLKGGPSHFNIVYPLVEPVAFDPDDPDPDAQHQQIGQETVHLIENLVTARNKSERGQAKATFDGYIDKMIKEFGVTQGRGRKPEGPKAGLLKELYKEGTKLTQVIWRASPDPSPETVDLISEHGTKDDSEIQRWVLRLALPILSLPEIMALQAEAAPSKPGKKPTEARFAVWLLAWRFGLVAKSVARKTIGSPSDRYFEYKKNPIKRMWVELA